MYILLCYNININLEVERNEGYLNRYKRLGYTDDNEEGHDVILPLTEDNKIFIAYFENGKDGEWNITDVEFDKVSVYNITSDGNEYICDVMFEDKKILLNLTAGQAVAVIVE